MFSGLVFILPWLFRITRGAILLAFAGLVGMVVGIPQSTERMAERWSHQVKEWGIPPRIIDRFNPVFRVWGFILIFVGWVVIGLVIGFIVVWVI